MNNIKSKRPSKQKNADENKSIDDNKKSLKSKKRFIVNIAYIIALFVIFLVNYTNTFDQKIDMNGDNIYYYSLANAINQGKGFTNIISFDESPHTHFPPGYSYFVAFIMKFGATSINSVKIANGVLLFIAIVLLFFLLSELCENKFIAFTAAAFSGAQVEILRFATIMMSEMLFLVLSFVVLLILLKINPEKLFTEKKKKWKEIALLAIMFLSLIYMYFVRTMALTLIFAAILYYAFIGLKKLLQFWKNRKTKQSEGISVKSQKSILLKYLLMFAIAMFSFIIPKTVWDARNKAVGKLTSDYVGDFFMKAGGKPMETIDDWTQRISNNFKSYITTYVPTAILSEKTEVIQKPQEPQPLSKWFWGFVILALILFAVCKLPRGGLILFLYIGITFSVLLLYQEQYSGHRYMVPIIPLLIFLTIYGVYAFIESISKRLFFKHKEINAKYAKILGVAVRICFEFI